MSTIAWMNSANIAIMNSAARVAILKLERTRVNTENM